MLRMWLLFWGLVVVGAAEESCFDCSLDEGWECPKEKRVWIEDALAPMPIEDRGIMTLPDGFVIKKSTIPDAGLGVFTTKNLSACVVVGPYDGDIIDDPEEDTTGYAWIINDKDDKPEALIDGGDTTTSNWLRYINSPMSEDTANLFEKQYKGEIYYQGGQDVIPAGTELFVWYGDEYAAYLGLMDDKKRDEL